MLLRELLLTYRITDYRESVEEQGSIWDVIHLENGCVVWILTPKTVTIWPDTDTYA